MFRIHAVSYVNTFPFLEGLEATRDQLPDFHLTCVPPAHCAESFLQKQCELALIPAAALLDIQGARVISGFGIGAYGPVDTVYLVANREINQLRFLLSDPESRTSNGLTRVLLRHYWKHQPVWLSSWDSLQSGLPDDTGAVIIGDKAWDYAHRFPFVYDLADTWNAFTGLPFMFAVWVIDEQWATHSLAHTLRQAFQFGIAQIPFRVEFWSRRVDKTAADIESYLTHRIRYSLDAPAQEALIMYLGYLAEIEKKSPPALRFC